MQLPLSNDYSDRVPMFTAFTSTKRKLSKPDSLLMDDIKRIASIIVQDSFWNAQVSQVNISPNRTFEIIPVLGNQVIKLGNADSLQSKFDKLTAFYKQIWSKSSFEKYESISVEFNGQIVAVKKGIPKPVIDTAEVQRLISAMQSGGRYFKRHNCCYSDYCYSAFIRLLKRILWKCKKRKQASLIKQIDQTIHPN